MNNELQGYARNCIKEGLAKLPEECHRTFKLMYARDQGRRSVNEALAMQINDVVDSMSVEHLDFAMTQVQRSIDKFQLN